MMTQTLSGSAMPSYRRQLPYTRHWGQAQDVETVYTGIVRYWTAGHGGYELNQDRMNEMPSALRACSFTGDNCFEEDSSWCAVVLAWPEFFSIKTLQCALDTFNGHYLKQEGMEGAIIDGNFKIVAKA